MALVVNFAVAICTSAAAVSEGGCTDKNALQVLRDEVEVNTILAIENVCMHLAYQKILSFPRPDGNPLAMTWSCTPKNSERE
jgi:hypothetical protein